MANSSSEDTSCYIDPKYYPHMVLIPAVIFMTILSFLERRTSFCKHVCGGRPGLVIPMDFLGVDHNRLAITAIFGAAAGTILHLVMTETSTDNAWESGFTAIGLGIEAAVLYYPLFACLAADHKLVGSIIGFLYGLMWLVVSMVATFDKCKFTGSQSWIDYMTEFFAILPTLLCKLFLLGKFIVVLYKEIKRLLPRNQFSAQELEWPIEEQFVKPWLYQYVRNILKPRLVVHDTKLVYYLRKIYDPDKNFRFSTQTVSVVMVCCILIYMLSIQIFIRSVVFLEKDTGGDNSIQFYHGFGVTLLVSTILTVFVYCLSIVRFMDCHKDNLLRMFKGDKFFIRKIATRSQFMVGQSLKYAAYQIGYLVWGCVILLMLFSLITGFLYSLKFDVIRTAILNGTKYFLALGTVSLLFWATLIIASMAVFRDHEYPKDVIAINNRKVYLVFSYFWFFIGLPMGLFSAILRVLYAMAISSVMLARIDCTVLPEGYQYFDYGYYAYLCYLEVQATFRNPVLRVFCQIVYHARRNTNRPTSSTRRFRNKWFLLVTLINNPALSAQRKHVLAQTVRFTSGSDIQIEVAKYGSLNSSDAFSKT